MEKEKKEPAEPEDNIELEDSIQIETPNGFKVSLHSNYLGMKNLCGYALWARDNFLNNKGKKKDLGYTG